MKAVVGEFPRTSEHKKIYGQLDRSLSQKCQQYEVAGKCESEGLQLSSGGGV